MLSKVSRSFVRTPRKSRKPPSISLDSTPRSGSHSAIAAEDTCVDIAITNQNDDGPVATGDATDVDASQYGSTKVFFLDEGLSIDAKAPIPVVQNAVAPDVVAPAVSSSSLNTLDVDASRYGSTKVFFLDEELLVGTKAAIPGVQNAVAPYVVAPTISSSSLNILDYDDIEVVAEDDGVCIESAKEHTRLKGDLEEVTSPARSKECKDPPIKHILRLKRSIVNRAMARCKISDQTDSTKTEALPTITRGSREIPNMNQEVLFQSPAEEHVSKVPSISINDEEENDLVPINDLERLIRGPPLNDAVFSPMSSEPSGDKSLVLDVAKSRKRVI